MVISPIFIGGETERSQGGWLEATQVCSPVRARTHSPWPLGEDHMMWAPAQPGSKADGAATEPPTCHSPEAKGSLDH